MARRYYLSRIVGAGTMTDKHRSKAGDLASAGGGNRHDLIPDGAAAGDWCLTFVDCQDHTLLLADPDVRDFPDLTLDAPLSSLSTAARNRLLTFVQTAGIDTSGIKASDTFRVVVRAVGRRFAGASFSEDAFDVRPAG